MFFVQYEIAMKKIFFIICKSMVLAVLALLTTCEEKIVVITKPTVPKKTQETTVSRKVARIPANMDSIPAGGYADQGFTEINWGNSKIKKIGTGAFKGNNITELALPDSVIIIEADAFKDNKITSLSFGKNVEIIGKNTFEGNSIAEVVLAHATTHVKVGAFRGNPLTKLTLGINLQALEAGAFNTSVQKLDVVLWSPIFQLNDKLALANVFGKNVTLNFAIDPLVNNKRFIAKISKRTAHLNAVAKDMSSLLSVILMSEDEVFTTVYADATNKTISKPLQPKRVGYIFQHWYKDKKQKENVFKNNQELSVKDGDILYAQWKQAKYKVIFRGNGGFLNEKQTIKYGEYAQKPLPEVGKKDSVLHKRNHILEGWREKDKLGMFDFRNTPITADVTLYAKWKRISYPVRFDMTGADDTSTIDEQYIDIGENAKKPDEKKITRRGYTFVDWFEKDAKGNLKSKAFKFATTPIIADITLYAKWKIISYTVTFDTNGDDVSTKIDSQSIDYRNNAQKPTIKLTKTGYTFVDWFEKDASGKFKSEAFKFATTPIRADIALYAKWKIISYTVTFDTNGADASTKIDSQSIGYGGHQAKKPTIKLTKTGYTFVDWFEKDAKGNFKSEAFKFSKTPIIADITLYAKWKIISYTVTFDTNGDDASTKIDSQSIDYRNNAQKPTIKLTKTGYTFVDWFEKDVNGKFKSEAFKFSTTPITGDTTLYALWGCKLTFDTNGDNKNTKISEQIVVDGRNAKKPHEKLTKTGNNFMGWFEKDLSGNFKYKAFKFSTNPIRADITLYAKWELKEYTVTFIRTDIRSWRRVETVKFEKLTPKVSPEKKPGYLFKGWYYYNPHDQGITSDMLSSKNKFDFNTKIVKNHILYAHWEKADGDTIKSIEMNGGPKRNQTYGKGEKIVVKVNFSNKFLNGLSLKIKNSQSPQITIQIGSKKRKATQFYRYGVVFLSNYMFFKYEVQPDDKDSDGIEVIANSFDLRGGTLKNVEDKDVILTHSELKAGQNHKVDGTK